MSNDDPYALLFSPDGGINWKTYLTTDSDGRIGFVLYSSTNALASNFLTKYQSIIDPNTSPQFV